MTGLGDRVHLASPDIDLDTHITDIVNVLRFEDVSDVILVGWSYGGTIVAGVADREPERLRHLVYLDSDVPRDGDTSAPPSKHAPRAELARLHGAGWRVPPNVLHVEDLLLAGLPEAQQRWIRERFVPHLLRTWLQPIHLSGAAATVPTTYIRCLGDYDPADEDTQPQDTRIRSEPTWRYIEMHAGHNAPFSAPEELARLLLDLV
jgi:pimeloyl-ACP methyl ester carboxylesterase